MAKSALFSEYLLGLIFNGADIPGLARNAAAPLTDLYVSLHTSALSFGDAQNVNETTYAGYSRVAVPRSALGFTLAGNQINLTSRIAFGEAASAAPDITHFAIGVAASGATLVLYSGPLDESIEIVAGVMPRLSALTNVDET